ncbi:MAG: thioredoxin family protein [Candidatus Hodarchaeota archaeon]
MPVGIGDETREHVEEMFNELKSDVRILFFHCAENCILCNQTYELLEGVSELSKKVHVERYDCRKDEARAKELNVERHPTTIIVGEKDFGVRYSGIMSGYEFGPFIESIVEVSKGKAHLSSGTLKRLEKLEKPVNIKVFTTPTCPYCPAMVRLAHRLAVASDKIQSEMIESMEFRDMALKYNVTAVPRTVINDKVDVVGLLSESKLLDSIFEAVKD